jgi:hypothetical protein
VCGDFGWELYGDGKRASGSREFFGLEHYGGEWDGGGGLDRSELQLGQGA